MLTLPPGPYIFEVTPHAARVRVEGRVLAIMSRRPDLHPVGVVFAAAPRLYAYVAEHAARGETVAHALLADLDAEEARHADA